MHPLLAGKRGVLYGLAWAPVAGMIALFLHQTGSFRWLEALAMAVPLSGLYAMICLSAWYLCRRLPLVEGRLVRTLTAPTVAAFAAASIWVGISRAFAAALAGPAAFPGLDERMARNESWLWATGVLLYLLSVSISYLLMELEAAREARTREVQAAMMAREAELKALRDQVSPHFLFNSLNSISALVGVDKQGARRMCVLLADFLRLSLGIGDRRYIPLEEELTLVRHYLSIEQVRFDSERLRLEEVIEDGALGVMVPPLVLQPLVENAVKHGIAQCVEGGVVRLEATAGVNDLMLAVTNTYDAEAPKRRGAGLGLENVRRRLQTLYGGGARLETTARNGEFRAEIRMLREAR